MSPSRLKFKDLEAWVEIDECELKCYKIIVDDLDPTDISCWIASEEGKNFAVKIEQKRETQSWMQAVISFDGYEFKPKLTLNPGTRGTYTFGSVPSLRKDKAEMSFMFKSAYDSLHHGTPTGRMMTGHGGRIRKVEKPGTIKVEIRRETTTLPLLSVSSNSESLTREERGDVQHRIVYTIPIIPAESLRAQGIIVSRLHTMDIATTNHLPCRAVRNRYVAGRERRAAALLFRRRVSETFAIPTDYNTTPTSESDSQHQAIIQHERLMTTKPSSDSRINSYTAKEECTSSDEEDYLTV